MSHTTSPLLRTLTSAAVTAGLLAAVTPALALNQFLKDWQDTYPNSTTGDASCALCHGTANTNLNAYGKALCDAFGGSLPADIVPALEAIEGLNSDLDPDGSSNIVEIDADAQPGWTEVAVNQIYPPTWAAFAQRSGARSAFPPPCPCPTTRRSTACRWRSPVGPTRAS